MRHWAMIRALTTGLALHCSGLPASAQDPADADTVRPLVVIRNVNLRSGPSTASSRIRLLRPPDEVALREDTLTQGFYAVRTEDDEDGWVWGRNVRPAAEPDQPVTAPTAAALANSSARIDDSWERPDANRSSFTHNGKRCGPGGDGGDEETNVRKNRTDVPNRYHDVTFGAIASLPYPTAPRHRHDWTGPQLSQIARFEGRRKR